MALNFESAELFAKLGECNTPTGRMGFTLKLTTKKNAVVQVYLGSKFSDEEKVIWELDQSDLDKIQTILDNIKEMADELKQQNKLVAITHIDKDFSFSS